MSWAEPLLAWLKPLLFLLAWAAAMELLLPEGGTRRYAEAVLGLVVLAAVLEPVLQWVRADLPAQVARYEAAVRALAASPALGGISPERRELPLARELTREAFAHLVAQELERWARQVPGVVRSRAWVELEPGYPPALRRVRVAVEVASGPAGGSSRPGAPVPPVRPVEPVPGSGGAGERAAPAPQVPPEVARAVRDLVSRQLGLPPERVEVVPLTGDAAPAGRQGAGPGHGEGR